MMQLASIFLSVATFRRSVRVCKKNYVMITDIVVVIAATKNTKKKFVLSNKSYFTAKMANSN